MRRAALPLLAFALLAVWPAGAGARVSEDPCRGDGVEMRPNGTGKVCEVKVEVPPQQTMQLGSFRPASGFYCPAGTQVRGSDRPISEPVWDYWTHRGEWVVWNGHWTLFPVPPEQGNRVLIVKVHNWGSWNWPTRSYFYCEPRFEPFRRVASVATTGVSEDERGTSHSDHIRGTGDADTEYGFAGNDTEIGGPGNDALLGGRGNDTENGGAGSDELFDNQGRDHISGGPGNDRVNTRDGNADTVDCGSGEDVALVDHHDHVTGCEHAYRDASHDPAHPPRVG